MPGKKSKKQTISESPAGTDAAAVEESDTAEVAADERATGARDIDGLESPQIAQDSTGGSDNHEAPHRDRIAERHHRSVKTVVQFRERDSGGWTEKIEVNTVSRNGAALLLSKPCPVGRILTLVMDMPQDLRLYDHFKDVYPIAGLVQNCTEVTIDDKVSYHVGVAFLGKQLPETYRENPSTGYRIAGVDGNGLWQVVETRSGYQDREFVRFWQSFDISVTFRDEVNKVTQRSAVKTRDVSRGGVAVWGPLDVKIGDRVKVSSKEHSFFSMGIVRNRTEHPKDESRSLVHIQFESAEFPIESLSLDGDGGHHS